MFRRLFVAQALASALLPALAAFGHKTEVPAPAAVSGPLLAVNIATVETVLYDGQSVEILSGLAISMLFGLLSSTLLTVLVIPAIYVVMKGDAVTG